MNKEFLLRTAALALLLISFAAQAAEAPSTELTLRDCIRKAMSRAALETCHQAALDSWQAELNTLETRVISQLPDDQRAEFERTAQQWAEYRDASFADLGKVGAGGWVYDPQRWAIKHEVIKGRIAVVEAYRSLLELRI